MKIDPSIVDELYYHSILVIGDVMLDDYIEGKLVKLSPEASVPLMLRSGSESVHSPLKRLGGAGNCARNVASLGAKVFLVGAIGMDNAGDEIDAIAKDHIANGPCWFIAIL
jgi:bifunctional ADP-heptose synthase (sugar kinase/adenylyltransferase)